MENRKFEFKGFLPKTWKLVRFKNYKTSRFIEFWGLETILNRDNRFMDLLIRGKDILKERSKKMAVEGFFRSLKMDLRSNFEKMIEKQREILKWFVEAGLIDEKDIDYYILTREDFPP